MIGGSQGIPRRSLREPNSSASSRHASSERAGAPPTGSSYQPHPNSSSRPLPESIANPNDISTSSNNLVQELTALSQRQLVFSPAISHNNNNNTRMNNNTINNNNSFGNEENISSMTTTGNNNNNMRERSSSDVDGRREINLLWKALEEERHVVKMKNEVINSLETNLKSERSTRMHLEAERDALRDTVENLRSQIQMSRSLQLADGETSPPFGSPPSGSSMKRPNPLPIGFASSGARMAQHYNNSSSKNITNNNNAINKNQPSAQKRRAALLFDDANGGEEELSPGMRAALANEYLETELNNTVDHFEKYGRQSLFHLADFEKLNRTLIEESFGSETSLIASSMFREQRSLLLSEEASSRRVETQSWCSATVEKSIEYSQDREQSAVKYFKQSFNRLEKELFINMQDLARADDRTSRHHDQLVRHVNNFYEHLQNLHYQCGFELFRGETTILGWRGALKRSSHQLPRWFSDAHDILNDTEQKMTDLFASSAKLVMQHEAVHRQRVATSQLMNHHRNSSSGQHLNNSNTTTPIGTPRAGGGGGGEFYQQQHNDNNNNNNNSHHQDPSSSPLLEGGDELFERIRHLEGRLAQKTRLIGLHVKRIQELEIELDSARSGSQMPATQQQQNPAAQHLLLSSSANNNNNNNNTPAATAALRNNNNNNNNSFNSSSGHYHQQHRSFSNHQQNNNNNNNNRRGSFNVNNNHHHHYQHHGTSNNNNHNVVSQQQLEEDRMHFAALPQNQVLNLFEDWRQGVTQLVVEMHDDLMMIVRPWSRVPRALLAQMYEAAQSQQRSSHRQQNNSSTSLGFNNNLNESQNDNNNSGASYIQVNPHLHPDAGGGQSPPKQSKTMYIRGLSRNDVKEHQDYENQAIAANLVNSPDSTFDNAINAGREGPSAKNANKTLWNHFFNYVSMSFLDEAREFSINLLREHDNLVSAFHILKPVIRSVDVVKVSLMEGALSLAEAQRDQALTSSHWIHTQAEQAVETLRGLVTKTEGVTTEQKGQSAEDVANQARAVAAARRLEELGSGGGGEGGGGHTPRQNAHGGHTNPASQATMQEVMTAFDSVQAQHSALGDPEQAENQRLAEEFASKCNLLVNRASFLYKRLIEREQDVDILSRSLAEVETKEHETRDSTDASIVAQALEREIADEALFMLREAMLAERQCAQESIRSLLEELQERNFAIRDLQRMLKEALMSCRFTLGIAEHAKYSFEAMHDSYKEMGLKLLRTQRVQLLPPISEVALQMFVAHFEYCDSCLQSHANFLDQAQATEANVDALVQRRKIYEKEMVTMGQEVFRLNQENRVARNSVKNLEQWALNFVTDSASYVQGMSAQAFTEMRGELLDAYSQVEQLKRMLPKNYVDVNEALEVEKFERTAFEERTRVLEQKLTRATTDVLETQHDLSETRQICEKLDDLRTELETNNRELEMLLLQEREAAEQLRDRNMSITDELTDVRSELANVKKALLTESEAHSATIRNFSRRHT